MNNTILLLTHGNVGEAMKGAVANILGKAQEELLILSVNNTLSRSDILNELETILHQKQNNNILILTDLFGSTPCNIASKLTKPNKIAVVSGLNLGMLLRSINYITLPFKELIKKATKGGKECIKTCE